MNVAVVYGQLKQRPVLFGAMFYITLALVLLFAFILFIVLFGDLPFYDDTIIFTARHFLVNKCYHHILIQGLTQIDDNIFKGRILNTCSKVSWIGGWIVPFFYISVMTGCVWQFFNHTYIQLTKLNQCDSSKLYSIIIPSLMLNVVSFSYCLYLDPGVVPAADEINVNKIWTTFPYDNLIYPTARICSTCHQVKPARSKHCSICNRCVLLFDHHCIWLNNDIGYYNYIHFFIFLLSTCWIMIYGGYACAEELRAFSGKNEIPLLYRKGSFVSKYWFIITKTTLDNKVSGTLLLLCIFLLPVVSAFLLEHIWLNYLGETTNETVKWDYIRSLIQSDLLYKIDIGHDKFAYIVPTSFDKKNDPLQFIKLNDGSPIGIVQNDKVTKVNGWRDLDNIYDKGFLPNMRLRLIPQNMKKKR